MPSMYSTDVDRTKRTTINTPSSLVDLVQYQEGTIVSRVLTKGALGQRHGIRLRCGAGPERARDPLRRDDLPLRRQRRPSPSPALPIDLSAARSSICRRACRTPLRPAIASRCSSSCSAPSSRQ